MYTEKDAERMKTWEQIYESLKDVADLYRSKLAYDSSADKPTFDIQLDWLIDTAKAQANLWRNPDTAETVKLERQNNIYSL